ncbi:MAG: UPF0149 family protein [Gammaproteobacteria bacterium]|nr:UPF0149 family protein [Gammaproteobacteria bacterium]
METTPDLPSYDEAARLLHEAGITTGASEAHGIITGVLSAPRGAGVAWQELVLGRKGTKNSDVPEALTQLLAAMHRSTYAHLSGVECDFAPLLPGDDYSLAEQIEGLTDWCRGYLFGLHAGGVTESAQLPGDAGEVVRDITRLSEAELDGALADEEEARALTEIVEYLRVGVQLVFEELQPPAARH